MDDCKNSRDNKYIMLLKMDDWYSSCDKNRYPTSKEEWF